MARDSQTNTAPILALVGAEILSLLAFVAVCEVRAGDVQLCESRWALALPAIALAGQSAATYFMDPGRSGTRGPGVPGPGGGGPDGSLPFAPLRPLPPRNRLGQFRSTSEADEDDAQAA